MTITTCPLFHTSLGLIASDILDIVEGRVPTLEDMRLLERALHECTEYVEARESEPRSAMVISLNAARSKRKLRGTT